MNEYEREISKNNLELRESVSKMLLQGADSYGVKVDVTKTLLTSTPNLLIAGTETVNREILPLTDLLTEGTPLFLLYLALPKRTGTTEGCYLVRPIMEDQRIVMALINENEDIIDRGTMSFTIGEGVEHPGGGCSISIGTSLYVSICCTVATNVGPINIQGSFCLTFSLSELLPDF